jgi:hypothetical protein
MNRPPRSADYSARRTASVRGWLLPAALLTLTPKCVLCLLAYAGVGAALGLGGPEICGGQPGLTGSWESWLLVPGAGLAIIGFLAARLRRDPPPCGTHN